MKRILALCFPSLLAASLINAQEPAIPNVVRTQVEYIAMPKEDLTRLLMEDKAPSLDATDLRAKVQAMVDGKQAEIIDTQSVVSDSGTMASSVSTHEFVYPTEYEPPGLPCGGSPEKTISDSFRNFLGTPTAFETRDLGSVLNVDATVGKDTRIVRFTITSLFTWHTGDTVWQKWKGLGDAELNIRMPDFYVIKVNTGSFCMDGKPALLSVLSPKDEKGEVDPDRKVMVFVKCDVLTSDAQKP